MTSYVHDFADEMEAGVTPDVVPAPVADVPDDDTVLVVLVVWLAAVPVWNTLAHTNTSIDWVFDRSIDWSIDLLCFTRFLHI